MDDTINISDYEDPAEYLRHLSDYCSCPCVRCKAICDRPERVSNCEAYQLWLAQKWKERELRDLAKKRNTKNGRNPG